MLSSVHALIKCGSADGMDPCGQDIRVCSRD